ncbi:hypothetical protein JQC91_12135 [Jannaschia sp. Os4]|uniref:hypothetical protein n=1 Tax=Jannaschia sp. Os4 TaxID=2807617 RepID=UPI00193ABBBD|nr:hypothetical protein [Jannaschia sp. Os4]MBM2577047.1 hypothetical protein [Jannaschia sp. Os4]
MEFALSALIAGGILVVLAVRAVFVVRSEPDRPRGVEPGEGYTKILSEYSSGVGGGERLITRVPRDPDAYARAFVPRKERR